MLSSNNLSFKRFLKWYVEFITWCLHLYFLAVLAIYLKSKLGFKEDDATVIYHAFSGLCYFTPIFGAMLADQFFGKFKTIFWISLIYVLGHLLKTLAAVTPLGLPPVEFSLIGLLLIALGNEWVANSTNNCFHLQTSPIDCFVVIYLRLRFYSKTLEIWVTHV